MQPYKNKRWQILIAVALLLSYESKSQGGIVNTSGTHLVANGSVQVVFNNAGLKNDGNFSAASSTLSFTGNTSTANSFLSGTGPINLYNLTLNKTTNGIQLNRNIEVSNSLLFSSGDSLFLNTYNIDLGTSGILSGETDSKKITGRTGGYIQRTQNLNAPVAENPGNIGIEITSTANMGSTVIRRGHLQQSGASCFRYFDITPNTNTALNATINFYYFESELGAISEPNLGMFFSDNGGSNWTNLGEDGIEQSLNYVTKNNFDHLNRLTISTISEPLAVSLLYFKATLIDHKTLLKWATDTESDNSHFEIQRSADGIDFNFLASTPAIGNSNSVENYSYIDKKPIPGINYYRLKLVDINGHFIYSPIVMVTEMTSQMQPISVFPNPASAYIKLMFTATANLDCILQITDINGKLVRQKLFKSAAGFNEMELDIASLPTGIYAITISGTDVKNSLFIKK